MTNRERNLVTRLMADRYPAAESWRKWSTADLTIVGRYLARETYRSSYFGKLLAQIEAELITRIELEDRAELERIEREEARIVELREMGDDRWIMRAESLRIAREDAGLETVRQ